MEDEPHGSSLFDRALDRIRAADSRSFAEAMEGAARGEGPFWSFRANAGAGGALGGEIVIIESGDDDDDFQTSRIRVQSGLLGSPTGYEDTLAPGDDLSPYQSLRFVPVRGAVPAGSGLLQGLASLLDAGG